MPEKTLREITVEALRPFAEYALAVGDGWPDDTGTSLLFRQPDGGLAHAPTVRLGDCRKALAALKELDAQGDETAALKMETLGLKKAYNLLLKGMESQCELMDGLKQKARTTESLLRGLLAVIFRDGGHRLDEAYGGDLAVATQEAQKSVAGSNVWLDDGLALLRSLEWSGTMWSWTAMANRAACPACWTTQGTDHAPDCRLALIIGAKRREA